MWKCVCICPSIYVISTVSLTTGTQAQVTPNKESMQTMQPTFLSKGKKSKGRSNTTLKPGKRRPQLEQVRKKKMMKRQRNTTQMKGQGRNSQDQINEEEISNLPEREFRIMIVKMLQKLESRMEKMQEAFNTVNTITKDINKQ